MTIATEKNPKGAGRKKLDHSWATDWAEKVVSGEIIASNKNLASAKRHLADLEVQNTLNYYWNPKEGNKAIKFIEMLPDPKTGKPMPLMLFQKYIIQSLFGWQDENGNRRFTKAYISTARKNGKSLISSGIALYELLFGKSPVEGREIYIASLTLRQAQTIYNMAYRQLNILKAGSKSLRNSLEMRKTDIVHILSDSKMMALSNNPDAIDGKNPSVVLLDELASMPDGEMYSRLKTGMGLQENPLTALISTASNNLNSPMCDEHKYVAKMVEGKVKNENYFYFCAELDSVEEMENEELWMKANPLLENQKHRPTILKNIKQDIQEQREKGDETSILIKNFNLWQSSSEATFISSDSWQDASIDEDIDITGMDTVIGLDLSKVDDLSAISFAHMLDTKKIYVDSHAFVSTRMPIDLKMKRDKTDYKKLEEEGFLSITKSESGVIDYGEIIDYILEYEKKHNLNIKEIVYDPYNIGQFFQAVEHKNKTEDANIKWTFVEQSQQMYKLSPIVKAFRIAVWNKKIVHSNNPILNIAVNNATVKEELNSNIRVTKKNRSSKIDPLAAAFNAYATAMHLEFKPKSASEKIDGGDYGFIII